MISIQEYLVSILSDVGTYTAISKLQIPVLVIDWVDERFQILIQDILAWFLGYYISGNDWSHGSK